MRAEGAAVEAQGARFAMAERSDADGEPWGTFGGRQGEEKFVILAAVESLFQRRAWGDGDVVQRGGEAGGECKAVEVEGETVAQIHAGGGAEAAEMEAEGEAGLGAEGIAGSRHGSEGAGDVENVAGGGSGTGEGAACGRGADDADVGGEAAGPGEVAAGERHAMETGKGGEAAIEPGEPFAVRFGRKGERDEAPVGVAAHGGDVAESAGEGFPAAIGGGMGGKREVDAIDEHVGGDQELAAAGRGEDGAIVADQVIGGPAADGADEVEFTHCGG